MCIYYTTTTTTTTTTTELPNTCVCVCVCVGGRGAHCYVEVSGTFHASYTLLVAKETPVCCGLGSW